MQGQTTLTFVVKFAFLLSLYYGLKVTFNSTGLSISPSLASPAVGWPSFRVFCTVSFEDDGTVTQTLLNQTCSRKFEEYKYIMH